MQDQPKGVDTDLEQISLSSYSEITRWCEALGCSEVQLAEAIALIGYTATDVRNYLANGLGAVRLAR